MTKLLVIMGGGWNKKYKNDIKNNKITKTWKKKIKYKTKFKWLINTVIVLMICI